MKQPVLEFYNAQGVRFRIYWRRITKKDLKSCRASAANGICFSPDSKNPKIIIDPKLKDKKKLKVLIEELFHAFVFQEKEKVARQFASTLAEMIILIGWRPEGKKK